MVHWAGWQTFSDWNNAGVITQGSTISDLAGKLGISSTGLAATVAKYNGFVTAKSDTDFNRPSSALIPIQTAPFYGIPCVVTHGSTNNGTLNIDTSFHVLDVYGNVIPHLYAAGDNGKAGLLSGTGVHVCWSYTSGRQAGMNAAAQTPWT
jgi:fumarate reductase flavoprotein subunit